MQKYPFTCHSNYLGDWEATVEMMKMAHLCVGAGVVSYQYWKTKIL